MRSSRAIVVEQVADLLLAGHLGDRPRRIGVDGITAAGKSVWADELTVLLQTRCHLVLHLSTDDFHYRRSGGIGRAACRRRVTTRTRTTSRPWPSMCCAHSVPAATAGSGRVHDLGSDQSIDAEPIPVPANGMVIIDGTFLQRAELDGLWDEMIYIDTDPRVARARAVQRDAALFGGHQVVERIYRTRYHAACALYAADADPVRRAGILIDNNDLNHPFVRGTTDCRG